MSMPPTRWSLNRISISNSKRHLSEELLIVHLSPFVVDIPTPEGPTNTQSGSERPPAAGWPLKHIIATCCAPSQHWDRGQLAFPTKRNVCTLPICMPGLYYMSHSMARVLWLLAIPIARALCRCIGEMYRALHALLVISTSSWTSRCCATRLTRHGSG
jgi:hypothetical protein